MQVRTVRHTGFTVVMIPVAALLAVWACSGEKSERESTSAGEDAAPVESGTRGTLPRHLSLHRLDGGTVPMTDFAGELIVVYFWATWNNDSRELIEIMNVLHPRHSRRFHFLAVSMDREGAAVVRSFMHDHRIAGDVIVNGEEVARAFGGIGKIPTTLVILRDGHIAQKLKGLYRREQYGKFLTYYGIPRVQDR